jgi:hypothetical protein
MLAAPDKLAADAAVVTVPPEDTVAVGPSASRALLAAFAGRKLAVDGAAREVRTERWGSASRRRTCPGWNPGGNPYRITAQLIALSNPDGSWAVVAVQYLAL